MKKIASLALAIYLACPLSAQTIANMKDLTAGESGCHKYQTDRNSEH